MGSDAANQSINAPSGMNTSLLLLTKHFPFNFGATPAESYLETEINYLADSFGQIYIVATEAKETGTVDCKLPTNVSYAALNLSFDKKSKLTMGLVGFFSREHECVSARKSENGKGLANYLFMSYYVGKAWKKWQALDVLLRDKLLQFSHVYSFWFFDTALVASWIVELSGAVGFARAHRYDLYENRNALGYLPCRRYQLDRLKYVFPCSLDGLKHLNSAYPEFEEKTSLLYLGTRDLSCRFREKKGSLRNAFVSCSSVTKVKRVQLLAEAFRILDESGVVAEWFHYGDGPELNTVKAIASNYKNVKVIFFGNTPNDKVLKSYEEGRYDFLVNVSSSEGLPISIMEACGCGLPVIATDVGGTSELVGDEVNGFLLVESVNAEDVSNALIRAMNMNESDYAQFCMAAREKWENSFRTSNNVRILLDTVLELDEFRLGKSEGTSE